MSAEAKRMNSRYQKSVNIWGICMLKMATSEGTGGKLGNTPQKR